jgi:hypothetical protein
MLPLSVSAVSEPPGRLRPRQASCADLCFRFDLIPGCASIFHRFRSFPSGRFRLTDPGLWHRPLTCFQVANAV